ncbi:hypothetical protein [Methylomagnum sp.]
MARRGLEEIGPTGDFVCLDLGGTHWLIPQGDIHALEPVIDMAPAGKSGAVGRFDQAGAEWPVYALSPDFELLPARPEPQRVAVLMRHRQRAFGVLCERVWVAERSRLTLHPVPPCMDRQPSPLLGLALWDGEVLCVSSAHALERWLGRLAT